MVKRLFIPLLIAIFGLMMAGPVLAAYYVDIDVTESNGTSYDMLPMLVTMDVDYLAEYGFISENGLDVRIKNSQGNGVPFMLAEDKVIFASDITGDMVSRFQLTTGNALLDNFAVCTGDGGYVTIADHADLEPSDDFEIEFDGYIDTSPVYDYPAVESTATSEDDGTTHDIDLPSDIESGDLLLICFAAYHEDYTRILTWPSGWTSLVNESDNNVISGVAYRISTGTESSPVTATTDDTCESVHHSYRITGYTGVPEAATTTTTVANANPDPPSLTTSWAAKTLWLAGFGGGSTNKRTLSGIPTNYADELYTVTESSSLSDYAHIGSARREYNYITDNPDTYTLSGNIFWLAWTVAICGSHTPIVIKDGAIAIIGGNDAVEATIYDSPTKTVTATVAAGEYTVIVGADSTNLYIKIDGDTKDTEALSGASVPDSANDWLLTFTYANYYKHTTSDTLRLTYQPDDIITGNTLPNELDAGTYDGTITWGSNPAGISISTSGLSTEETYYIEDIDSGIRDIISPEPAELISGVNLERLESNPLHLLVEVIVAASGGALTVSLVWIGGAWFLFIAALIGVFIGSKQNLVFTATVGLGLSILFYFMGIFDYWVIIIFGFGTVAAVIHERMPTW
ncbi:MAG TPA: hypothetical protein VMW50_06370 [Dehalococcoidia bacterium]|nr:hypothetical protein [Dehalococcoidia bacterium]